MSEEDGEYNVHAEPAVDPARPRETTVDGSVDAVKVKGQSTQVAHPWQAVKRTMTLVGLVLVLLNGFLALVVATFDAYLPPGAVAWIVGANGFIATLAVFVQRAMALEGIQPLLEKLGLGTGVEKE